MIRFHVDDVMSSHINPKVNNNFDERLQAKYGEYGEVKAHRGKVQIYLRMIFEYEDEGKVKVDMSIYVKSMLDDFPVKLKKSQTAATTMGEGLYNLGQGKDDEVPEWYARYEAYFERRKPTEYKVVCGCVVPSTPRLQKSNQRNNDIQKRSSPVAIKEAKAQHKEQYRSRASGSR